MKTPKHDRRCYQSKQQDNRGKPQNTQLDDTDAKIRSLSRYVDWLYYRDPIGTVVGIVLIILTAPIWYPIGLLIKYRQLVIVSILVLVMTQCSIKTIGLYVGKDERESVLIKSNQTKD